MGCVHAVMAWGVKDNGREERVGLGNGQRSEHGVHQRRLNDGA